METRVVQHLVRWKVSLMLATNANLFLATPPTSHKNQGLPDCGLSLRSWVFSHSCSVLALVVRRRFPAVLEICWVISFLESLSQQLILHTEVWNEHCE